MGWHESPSKHTTPLSLTQCSRESKSASFHFKYWPVIAHSFLTSGHQSLNRSTSSLLLRADFHTCPSSGSGSPRSEECVTSIMILKARRLEAGTRQRALLDPSSALPKGYGLGEPSLGHQAEVLRGRGCGKPSPVSCGGIVRPLTLSLTADLIPSAHTTISAFSISPPASVTEGVSKS